MSAEPYLSSVVGYCFPQAATWTPTASNHVSKYSCTSDCASVSFSAADLDKTTNYALFGLNTNTDDSNIVTGASAALCIASIRVRS